jgi:hypothetical protein
MRGLIIWRGPFGDVEIELHPAAIDAKAADASQRELGQLARDWKYRDPEARRVVSAIRARLRFLGASALLHCASVDLDFGSPRADALSEELLAAGRAGTLIARRRKTPSVIVRLEGAEEPLLGPDSRGEAGPTSKSWIGLVLVDQDGAPVPNRPYRVVKPDATPQDGTLDSHGTAMVRDLDPGNCQIWCPYVEPHPETSYTVQPGDHISGIAQSFGFDDYSLVWNDPGNADLASQRNDPHVLQPGDSLAIPKVQAQAPANKPTGAKHTFTIQRSPLKLRLRLVDLAAKPVSGAQVTVSGNALTTDGDGVVELTIDKNAKDAPLDTPSSQEVDLTVGGLNPSEDTTVAGYKARLFNLGFLWDPTVADADDEMIIAVQDFQAQHQLPVTGELDDATTTQLLQAYGC